MDSPHSSLVKINYDVAYKNSTAATAIVECDSSRSILHVYGTPCHALSPLHAKVLAIHSACHLASRHTWYHAIVESDSQVAISLSSTKTFPPWSIATLVVDIIIANVIPPDHVDDVPAVEPNQPDDVLVILELILVDEDEDPKEEEFEEEEEPQEVEDDIKVDIEVDENEPELTYPYEEMDPLNPPPPASDSEPEDVIEVEDMVEPEDETVPASFYEVGESSTAPFLQEDSDGLLPGLMRQDINSLFGRIASLSRCLCGREMAYALVKKKGKAKDEYYGKLILDLGNEVRSSVEEGTTAMENLVRKLSNAEEKAKTGPTGSTENMSGHRFG
ncbi:putative reverse transcriptase domain-containing protein [Tanacetum coccineum]